MRTKVTDLVHRRMSREENAFPQQGSPMDWEYERPKRVE